MKKLFIFITIIFLAFHNNNKEDAWIRINRLGYKPNRIKIAVWCSKEDISVKTFQLRDAETKKFVFTTSAGKSMKIMGL